VCEAIVVFCEERFTTELNSTNFYRSGGHVSLPTPLLLSKTKKEKSAKSPESSATI